MPRQFGKVDQSVDWSCRCGFKHAPAAFCPTPGIWLVLALCHACNPRTGAYCRAHGGSRRPEQEVVTVDGDDLAALGEEERRRIGGDA